MTATAARAEIEAARQAWLATGREVQAHLGAYPTHTDGADCATCADCATLIAAELTAWKTYRITCGEGAVATCDTTGLLRDVRCEICWTSKKLGQYCSNADCPGRGGGVSRIECHRCGARLADDGRCSACRERVTRRRREGLAS